PATFLPVMARQVMDNPAVFGWSWPIFGLAAMVSTLIAAALPGRAGNRRIWFASQLIMAFGVVLPAIWPGIVAIVAAALCVGGTFMVITMVSMQEARAVGGLYATGLIAAMTASFALGQIAGPLCVSYVVGAGGSLSAVLLFAAALLAVSACALWPGFTDASLAKTD
ncbi:MAG TPA: YbfB/YjiJ family MFS transporter, partial [Burkholderiales bacterium]|nr:YbfB/YjiJ family MFS transporter [Burkholderiales bacterium]